MNKFSKKLVDSRMAEISPYLNNKDSIIDIGSGNSFVSKRLKGLGHNVIPIDIKNKSKEKSIQPVIYDGEHIPFEDNTFDVALLLTVLHHTPNPFQILKEAKRVANRIIIMEDLYGSTFQKYATFIMDSTLNLEFFGHPHSNKTDREWLHTFENLNLEVLNSSQNNFWKIFTNGTYYLRNKQ